MHTTKLNILCNDAGIILNMMHLSTANCELEFPRRVHDTKQNHPYPCKSWSNMGMSIVTVLHLVFQGPVHKTEKKTETRLNWTAKDQTHAVYVDQYFAVLVAVF
jgi:hypothetical protein